MKFQTLQMTLPQVRPLTEENDDAVLAKKAKVDSWKLEAVLGKEIVDIEVEKVAAATVEVLDRKKISYLVKMLSAVAPLGNLQHLKRVKSCQKSASILLWPSEVAEGVLDKLCSLGVDVAGLGKVAIMEVASRQPITRAQFDHLREEEGYWPSSFHEDKEMESLLSGSHRLWGKKAREEQEKMLGLCGDRGGVVADGMEVVAHGQGSSVHPLAHTAMVLVDLVARSQGGGAWSFTNSSTLSFTPVEQLPPQPSSDVPSSGPYLCTGYTVYLAKWVSLYNYTSSSHSSFHVREPCHMCAMGLLHSRVTRVLFKDQSRDGALVTIDRLQERDGINHRFQVFKVVQDDQGGGEPLGVCC